MYTDPGRRTSHIALPTWRINTCLLSVSPPLETFSKQFDKKDIVFCYFYFVFVYAYINLYGCNFGCRDSFGPNSFNPMIIPFYIHRYISLGFGINSSWHSATCQWFDLHTGIILYLRKKLAVQVSMKARFHECDYTLYKYHKTNAIWGYITFKRRKHCLSESIQSQKRCFDEFDCIPLWQRIFWNERENI